MLSSQQLQQFDQNGFVKGSRVLDDAQTGELCAEVLRVIEDEKTGAERPQQPVLCRNLTGDADNPVWQVVNIWEGSPAFARLTVNNSALIEEVAQIMGEQMDAREIRLFHDQIQYKPAQKGGVNMWHQDSPLWPILTPKNVQLTAWIALDDADVDNGCMSMVPGSQKWGDHMKMLNSFGKDFAAMPAEFEGHQIEIEDCPVERGAVHFHNALTWHGSRANLSGRPRRAVALHFMTQSALYRAEGEHPMKPFVEAADGEPVRGEHFPLVWTNDETLS